jgi:hypothetical protein
METLIIIKILARQVECNKTYFHEGLLAGVVTVLIHGNRQRGEGKSGNRTLPPRVFIGRYQN